MATENEGIALTGFFGLEDILISDEHQSHFNAVRALVHRIVERHALADESTLFNGVLMRERAATTVLGNGIALPHARVSGIDRPYMAVGVYPRGVSFESGEPPGGGVRLLFLLLIPESQPGRYLQILRALTKIVRDPAAVSAITAMKSADEVMAYFRRGELTLPVYVCAADLMNEHFPVLNESEPLSHAFNFFVEHSMEEIPVVDREGEMLGVINIRLMLNKLMPLIFRRADDAAAPADLGPLVELVNKCRQIQVGDVFSDDFAAVSVDTPAMKVAEAMNAQSTTVCYVLNDKELVGVIPLGRFFGRILRE